MKDQFRHLCVAAFALALVSCTQPQHIGPLPAWNNTASRAAIIDYVRSVTASGSTHFIPVSERVAVFDNDGTLWAEQPFYVQLAFALDRLTRLASQHPEWADDEDFANALKRCPW